MTTEMPKPMVFDKLIRFGGLGTPKEHIKAALWWKNLSEGEKQALKQQHDERQFRDDIGIYRYWKAKVSQYTSSGNRKHNRKGKNDVHGSSTV